MVAPKIWQARMVPVRLVSITRDQSASLTSSVGTFWVMPAAFTRISTLPNAFSTASCNCSIEARSNTSQATRSERRPSASISAAVASTCCCRRELGATSAPARARPSAISRPRPVVPANDHRDPAAQIEKSLSHRTFLRRLHFRASHFKKMFDRHSASTRL